LEHRGILDTSSKRAQTFSGSRPFNVVLMRYNRADLV
jgi:hypothetical protein